MTSLNTTKPSGAATSGPDIVSEVEFSKNPAYEKIPQFYLENFPGLFDKDAAGQRD